MTCWPRTLPLANAILDTAVPRLAIAPSTMDLSGLELEIAGSRDRAFRLRRAIEGLGAASAAIIPMCWSTARRR